MEFTENVGRRAERVAAAGSDSFALPSDAVERRMGFVGDAKTGSGTPFFTGDFGVSKSPFRCGSKWTAL